MQRITSTTRIMSCTEIWYCRSNDHLRHLVPQCPNIALTGPIVRLASERYSIDDPEGAKIIYNTTNVFRKSRWYWAHGHPDPYKSNIFAEGNNKEALRMRRNFAPAFQMGAILTYEPHMDECSRILKDKFREFAATSDVADIGHWMLCYAFDVQGMVTVS